MVSSGLKWPHESVPSLEAGPAASNLDFLSALPSTVRDQTKQLGPSIALRSALRLGDAVTLGSSFRTVLLP